MAYRAVSDMFFPPVGFGTSTSSMLIDATGEKAACRGYVEWPGTRTGTKDIRRVHLRFSTVTKSGGSGLTLSLQNVGADGMPDETQDQTVAISNGDSGFDSNAWYRSGTLSADRTVSFGDILSIVLEFDGSGRLGSDAVRWLYSTGYSSNAVNPTVAPVLKTGGSWALASGSAMAAALLEFSDGSFGTLGGCLPFTLSQGAGIASNSNPDEVGLKFTTGFKCKVDGIVINTITTSDASDFDAVLYNNTTPLVTGSREAGMRNGSSNVFVIPIAETELDASIEYIVAYKPTTTTSSSINYIAVDSASHLAVWPMGTSAFWTQRTDAGAWSDTTTLRPLIGLRLSAIDDGSGGGGGGSGGLLVHPGMSGGML